MASLPCSAQLCLHPSVAQQGRYLGRGGKPPGGGAQPAEGCRPVREKLQGVPARVAGQGVAQAGDGDLARALYSVPAVYDTYRYICSAQAARKAKPRMQAVDAGRGHGMAAARLALPCTGPQTPRSEAGAVGKGGVSTGRYGWSPEA